MKIDAVAHGGDGVGRIEGQVCFVPFGLPGDTLRVRVTRRAKKVLFAEIVDVLEPSPHRIEAACANFGTCGGCRWAHFAYPAQAEWKRRIVRDAFSRIAGIEVDPGWLENPKLRLGYRTRAEFHGDGTRLGFYALGSHDVVDTGQCPLCHAKLNEALVRLRGLSLKGTVTVTVNPDSDEVLVWTKFVKRKLKQYFPAAQSPRDESSRACFRFDGVPIVNGAFAQSSLLLNRLLVKTAHAMIGKAPSVLDLYCGNGNLSAGLSRNTEVVGMDHNKFAVKAACTVRQGAYRVGGETKMRKLIAAGEVDTILLDPPRAGAKSIMPTLAACGARAIVYVSCDPATLARDVKTLAAAGWKLTETTAIDLFPNTAHVETVCRLER